MNKEEIRSLLGDIKCNHDQYGYLCLDTVERIDNAILELQDEECKHTNTKKVHDSDCFPYGEGVEYEQCLDCGEKINFKTF